MFSMKDLLNKMCQALLWGQTSILIEFKNEARLRNKNKANQISMVYKVYLIYLLLA